MAVVLVAQVYTLEKVLKLKRDQNTQLSFLDEAMSVRRQPGAFR